MGVPSLLEFQLGPEDTPLLFARAANYTRRDASAPAAILDTLRAGVIMPGLGRNGLRLWPTVAQSEVEPWLCTRR